MDFRQAVKLTIDKYGITQREIAERTGISEGEISRYCNARKDFTATKLYRLIDGLHPKAKISIMLLIMEDFIEQE